MLQTSSELTCAESQALPPRGGTSRVPGLLGCHRIPAYTPGVDLDLPGFQGRTWVPGLTQGSRGGLSRVPRLCSEAVSRFQHAVQGWTWTHQGSRGTQGTRGKHKEPESGGRPGALGDQERPHGREPGSAGRSGVSVDPREDPKTRGGPKGTRS